MTVAPDQSGSQIAYLKATDPLDSLRSSYTLWLMDRDGSNAHQIYPPVGENSRFPRERMFMDWGPAGQEIAFVYDDALFMLDLAAGEAQRITKDDSVVSNPTWAPYGRAVTGRFLNTRFQPTRTPVFPSIDDLPPE